MAQSASKTTDKRAEDSPEEPYQSLYRRYRPRRFEELRGQDHVVHALRNAVANERVAHAYLFSGPRGTGKTSTARILAKALNCEVAEQGEPCGRCDSCRSIDAGSSFDVHELDAASNNGVDAMRDLIARTALASPGRWKVYIIDEVHMLSSAASNALLKTLEEPPGHVVFVLATTDPQKVLPTIRSRTQHLEFHLLNDEVLDALLADVAKRANLELPDGAVDVARRRARGSARDALSVLDQVATAGVFDDDADALGAIVGAIADREPGRALHALDDALHHGRDPHQVAIELVERLRAGFLGIVAPELSTASQASPAERAEASALGAPRCVRAMELIGASLVAMRDAPDPRITLEVALIRLTNPEADDSPGALVERIERLERRIEAGGAPARPAPSRPAPAATPAQAPTQTPTPARQQPVARDNPPVQAPEARSAPNNEAASTPAGSPSDLAMPTRDDLVRAWGDHILVGLRPKVRMIYQAGRFVEVAGDDAVFALPNVTQVTYAEPLVREVATVLSSYFGRPVGLRVIEDHPTAATGAPGTHAAPQDAVVADHTEELAELTPGSDDRASDPKMGIALAEDRILQAFPGTEEVLG